LESHGQGPAYAGSGLLGVLPVALYGFIQPATTTVELDDLLAHCQTDTGTGVFFASVQPLEDHEDSFRVLRFDTDSVVDTAEDPFVTTTFDADVHARRVLTPELHGVADEVEEHLGEQGAVTLDGGQRVVGDHCLDLFQASGQAAERIPQSHVEVDGGEILGPADPGKGQQVVDEGLHTLGALDGEVDVGVGTFVELPLVTALQQLTETRHLTQRLLQVVRGHVGELLQFQVGTAQFLGLTFQKGGLLLEFT